MAGITGAWILCSLALIHTLPVATDLVRVAAANFAMPLPVAGFAFIGVAV